MSQEDQESGGTMTPSSTDSSPFLEKYEMEEDGEILGEVGSISE